MESIQIQSVKMFISYGNGQVLSWADLITQAGSLIRPLAVQNDQIQSVEMFIS